MASIASLANGLWFMMQFFLVTFLLYIFSTALYNVYFHPLARFPGPILWSAFRFPYIISLQRGRLHKDMRKFHDEYPELGIVRIAPNELSFTTPDMLKDVLVTRPGHDIFPKNKTWFPVRPGEPFTITGPDEEAHARLRRAIAPAFTSTALKDQAPLIESHVQMLIDRLQEQIDPNSKKATVDLVEWINYLTFDIVGDLALGEPFGCLRDSALHPWVKISSGFGKAVGLITSVGHYPPFQKYLRYLLPKSILLKRVQHQQITMEKLQQRLKLETQRPDFITAMTRYDGNSTAEKVKGMSQTELSANLGILIFAGSETTASGLCGILRMLVQNRGGEDHPMDRAAREVRRKFPREEHITIESLALNSGEMDYLQAVIDEGIRLCPPVVIGIPRLVPIGGDTICGHNVPENTYVAYNQYAALRSPANFYNPDAFIPERWLPSDVSNATAEKYSKDRKDAFQVFGIGRHMCIGKTLAQAELRLTMARLLWKFDMRLQEGAKAMDWGDQKTVIFWEKEPLLVEITERMN